MLNVMSDLEFTFACYSAKGGGHQCLEYISRTDWCWQQNKGERHGRLHGGSSEKGEGGPTSH